MRPTIILTICIITLPVLFIKTMAPYCKMTNAICESTNKSWVTFEQCRLRAISRNKTVFNAEATIVHPANDVLLNLQLKKKANGYKPWLFNYTIDACAFLRRMNHPVFKIVYDLVREYSSVNHTCPYVGKQMVKGFFWDPRNLTLPIPSGDYLLLLTWMFKKEPTVLVSIYFSFHQDMLRE